MSTTISDVERARIFRFVLEKTQGEVADRIEGLVTALRDLDELYCSARDEMSRAERDPAGRVLNNARATVAKTVGDAA